METFVAIAGSLTVLTFGVVIAAIEAIFRAYVRHSAVYEGESRARVVTATMPPAPQARLPRLANSPVFRTRCPHG